MNAIAKAFPNLCSLLVGSEVDDDISNAVEMAASDGEEELRTALESQLFEKNELMWWLCGEALLTCGFPEATEMEAALAAVSQQVADEAIIRAAYRDKLLVNDKNALIDTFYELMVAARTIEILDEGSVEIEKKIEGTGNNSDLYGTFSGQKVRIEVTVLHETLQPTCHIEFDDLVRDANIQCGFSLSLRLVMETQEQADRVRALVELLYGEHNPQHEFEDEDDTLTIEVDGVRFTRKATGPYRCNQRESHIDSILFEDSPDIRELNHPVFTRSMTPRAIRDDFKQPENVITSADVRRDPDTHNDNPLSGKIGEALGKKRRQCEEGVVNIIAYCNPLPMNDSSFFDTVYGTKIPVVPFTEDKDRVRHFQDVQLFQNHKAPFVPFADISLDDLSDKEKTQLEEERQQFAVPFEMVSAVWLFRRGPYKRQVCLPNPNATCPVPSKLATAMTDVTAIATTCFDISGSQHSANLGEPEHEVVWTDLADDFVTGCETFEAAETALSGLRDSGQSLEEIQSAFYDGEPQLGLKGSRTFYEPTHEELAMNFVIGCGSVELAEECLAEWHTAR